MLDSAQPTASQGFSWLSAQPTKRYYPAACNFALFAFAMVHVLICLRGDFNNFPTVDEVGHLPAGVSHWKFGRFDLYRVNPPLVRSICTSVVVDAGQYDWSRYSVRVGKRPEFEIGLRRLASARLATVHDYVLPRIVALSFSLLGLFVGYFWLRTLFPGSLVPILFSACWAVSPNILAHATTIGPDVGAVAIGMVAAYLYWSYLQRPSRQSAIIAGIALGVAILTKLTWLTAIVSLPAVVLVCHWTNRQAMPPRKHRTLIGELLLATVVATLVVNIGYCFEGTLTKLADYQFCSKAFGGEGANRFSPKSPFYRSSVFSSVPVPIPRNLVLGIDFLQMEVEEGMWSFLMGEWRHGSWPHYYFMTTLFKTPEPTLLAALIGLGVLLAGIRRKLVAPKVIAMFLFLGIPAGVCFTSVGLQGGFNHHHRYVLMIYPFLFALAAYVASPVAVKLLRFRIPFLGRKQRSIAIPLAITLVMLSAASSLRVHPHYTSYFNTLSGGPENGWQLLANSNIDWGQDLLEVDKWIKQHPDCRPLAFELDYFGMSGDLFGLPNASPPLLAKDASIDDVRTDETQWWIVSVKKLYNLPGQDGLEYLQKLEPVDKIAYAYHVYRIDPKVALTTPSADRYSADSF